MMSKILLAVFCAIGLVNSQQISPVFLWGVDGNPKPALTTIGQSEFTDLLAPYLKDHMIVSFEEKNFSPRDLSCYNEQTSKSCFAKLQSIAQKTYYSNVENPRAALNSLTVRREYNSVDALTGQLIDPIDCAPGQVHIISFDADDSERNNALEAHDVAISQISEKLSSCKVVYIYTASPDTSNHVLKRHRRDETPPTQKGTFFRKANQFLMYYYNIKFVADYDPTNTKPNTATELTFSTIELVNASDTQFNATLVGQNNMNLKFTITKTNDGYFQMTNIQYDRYEYKPGKYWLNAPTTFSYHCSNLTLQSLPSTPDDPYTLLLWNGLQFQAPFDPKTHNDFKFGDAWACIGFFTPGILSGLFVMALLLAITFTGICWMVDINTMDRFDDPKGKTITVTATD